MKRHTFLFAMEANMPAAETAQPTAWYANGHFRRVSLFVLAVFIVVEGVIAIFFRENDFQWHILRGQEFLAGDAAELRADWYSLARFAFDGALAALPYRLARGLVYGLAIFLAAWSMVLWNRMDESRRPCGPHVALAASVLSVFMAITLVQRDLDECGLQLVLLGLLTLSAYAIDRGRDIAGAAWMALAVAFKTTPILFVALLLWKRRFRAAGYAIAFTLALNLLPATWIGARGALDFNQRWAGRILLSSDGNDPSYNHIESPKPQNQSLSALAARYLESFAYPHPLWIDHPAFTQFLALDGRTAGRVLKVCLLLGAAIAAWRMRRPWTAAGGGRGDLPAEWAATCVMIALLSPLCWKQHLVMMLPCLCLSLRAAIATGGRPRWQLVSLATTGLLLVISGREFLGRDLSIVIISYKPYTLAALLSVVHTLSLTRVPAAAVGARSDDKSPTLRGHHASLGGVPAPRALGRNEKGPLAKSMASGPKG